MNRWHAVITYRTVIGPNPVEHDLEELSDLHDLVERGPHWDAIESIVVTRANYNTATDLTVEKAAAL